MSDLNDILKSIILNPDEDTPRLMYADALDEHAGAETVQCEKCDSDGMERYCSRFMYSCAELGFECDCKSWSTCKACEGSKRIARPDSNAARAKYIRGAIENKDRGFECYEYPTIYDVGFETPFGRELEGRWDRGFLCEITCSAAAFLKHADELLWHPGQVVEKKIRTYPADQWGPAEYEIVTEPRPCPPTAQPIRSVTITELATADNPRMRELARKYKMDWYPTEACSIEQQPIAWRFMLEMFRMEWPGVEFKSNHQMSGVG